MRHSSVEALPSAPHDFLYGSKPDAGMFHVEARELDQPAFPELAGLRILIAEDNAVNQYLMARMLEKEGCRVVLASTGREALLALDQQPFDLVLMDVQMPDMNGFEATAAIRTWEQGRATHLPIIALTAHARQDDLQRCLAAGMDAYLCKPLKMTALSATVEHVCGHRSGRQTMPTPPPVDLSALIHRVHGDRLLLAEIIDLFIGRLPQQLAELREAVSMRNAAAVEVLAHTLKGTLGNLEAHTASALSHRLETLGSQGVPEDAAGVLQQLERELERIAAFFADTDWRASL